MGKKEKLILLICFVFILGLSLFYLSAKYPLYPTNYGYFTISSNSTNQTTYFIGVFLDGENDDAKYFITEWNNSQKQSDFYVILPERPNQVYILVENSTRNISSFSYTPKIYLSLFLDKRPLINEPFVISNLYQKVYVLSVVPQEVKNYYGIEFTLKNQVREPSFSEKTFILPLEILDLINKTTIRSDSKYIIQVLSEPNYELITAIPQPSRYFTLGHNQAMYQFDIENPEKGNVILHFEDKTKTQLKNNIILIISLLIGTGITLCINIYMQKEE